MDKSAVKLNNMLSCLDTARHQLKQRQQVVIEAFIEWRKSNELTHERIAQLLGLNVTTNDVKHWENSNTLPDRVAQRLKELIKEQ